MIIDYRNKYRHLITEGTYKQLANIIQSGYFKKVKVDSYQQLSDQQKTELKQLINAQQLAIKEQVEKITDNMYYQSWIYDILISGEQKFPEDFDKINQAIQDFVKISRSSKLTSEQKDIKSYKTFSELHKFLYEFKQQYTQYQPLEYDLFYQNDKYAVYQIDSKDFAKFSKLLHDLDIAWCVKQRNYFNHYKPPYFMIVAKQNNKPYALLHINSHQIKDVHDAGLKDPDPMIIDIFNQFEGQIEFSGDFKFYVIPMIKAKDPNINDNELFCKLYPKFHFENGMIKSEGNVKVDEYMIQAFIVDGALSLTFDPSVQLETIKMKVMNSKNLVDKLSTNDILKYTLGNKCIVKDDGTVDLLVDIIISTSPEKPSPFIKDGKLLVKFNKCKSFNISNCGLTTLEGCPSVVEGAFNCSGNKLTTLEHGPAEVKYNYTCSNNPELKSLDNIARDVQKVSCINTGIRDLHSSTLKSAKFIEADDCEQLISLNMNYQVSKQLSVQNCKNLENISSLSKQQSLMSFKCTGCDKIDVKQIPPNLSL